MDTTQKNILMCEKAEKIQQAWKPQTFDCFVPKKHLWVSHPYDIEEEPGYLVISCAGLEENDPFGVAGYDLMWNKEDSIYLPRQEELQKMVIDDFDGVQDMFCNFSRWIYDEPYKTAEQLWLAFVMEGKFQKKWVANEKDWINA